MKIKINRILASFVGLCMAVVLFTPGYALAEAFGISPPWIKNDNLKTGSTLVYNINLSASGLSENMVVHSEFQGDPEIEQWFTIQNREELVIKPGDNILPVTLLLKVPEGPQLAEYTGGLKFSLLPQSKSNEEGLSLRLGGTVAINLKLVDYDVTDFWVQSVDVKAISQKQPIDLKMSILNLGNTSINRVLTEVDVYQKKSGDLVFSGSADALNSPVLANSKADAKLSFLAPDLVAGDYWLDVKVFKGNEAVYENRLSLAVGSVANTNSPKTLVQVVAEGGVMLEADLKDDHRPRVKTTVKVRAPYTEKLIMVAILVLIVLTVIVAKTHAVSKKRRR